MLAARFTNIAVSCGRGFVKPSKPGFQTQQLSFVRSYREGGRTFTRRTKVSRIIDVQAKEAGQTLKTPIGRKFDV